MYNVFNAKKMLKPILTFIIVCIMIYVPAIWAMVRQNKKNNNN